MKTASKELQKLRSMAETSLNKTAELQKVLAQIEASLSRAESQKVLEKKNKNQKSAFDNKFKFYVKKKLDRSYY